MTEQTDPLFFPCSTIGEEIDAVHDARAKARALSTRDVRYIVEEATNDSGQHGYIVRPALSGGDHYI